MSKKGLYEEIKILAENKIKEAKEKHDIELSSTIDELSSKTKSEHDDIDTDYYKYILGLDYDEIVKSTDQELKSKNIDLNKLNVMKSDEGSSTLSTTKIEKFTSDSDSSSFDDRIEKLLIEEQNITYKYEQKSKTDRTNVSYQEIVESTSVSAESFISYKTNKLKSIGKLEDQMEMLEERLVKLKEQREAEDNQPTESEKVVEEHQKVSIIHKHPQKLLEKPTGKPVKPLKEQEEIPEAKQPTKSEEWKKLTKAAEGRIKSPKVAEELEKVSGIHKHPQNLVEKPSEKPVKPIVEQLETLKEKQPTKSEEWTKLPKMAEEGQKVSVIQKHPQKLGEKPTGKSVKPFKEQQEIPEAKQPTKSEEWTKLSKAAEGRIKSPKVAEELEKVSGIHKQPQKLVEKPPSGKLVKPLEEQQEIPKEKQPTKLEERTKSPKVAEEQQKVSVIHKQTQKLAEKPTGKPVKPLEEQQDILKVQNIKNNTNDETIRQKLNNFLDSSDNILKQAENNENDRIKSKVEHIQLNQIKRQSLSRENTPTNIAAMPRETKESDDEDGKYEYDKNRMRALGSRQSTRSGYNRRISYDSTQRIQTPDILLNEPIDESKVEEEFQINEKLLSRMLEENKLMAMKIHPNRFHDDKSIQLSFIDENIEENIESSLSDDMTMSKKLSCAIVKPITKRFKRKNLSFSDAEVRKIECENKHLESRIREMMKKGTGLSYNPSAKYCIQSSSSINRRKLEAQTCRENLKIERKIRDIKSKSNQKAPWAVPVWI